MDNQFDVSSRIIEIMKRLTKQEITPMVAATAIATEVEKYAELKVKQFKTLQNEVGNINEKA
jgi:hypothetical protein